MVRRQLQHIPGELQFILSSIRAAGLHAGGCQPPLSSRGLYLLKDASLIARNRVK
jgi:hypothetical protein